MKARGARPTGSQPGGFVYHCGIRARPPSEHLAECLNRDRLASSMASTTPAFSVSTVNTRASQIAA
jgi:hypothetical protein